VIHPRQDEHGWGGGGKAPEPVAEQRVKKGAEGMERNILYYTEIKASRLNIGEREVSETEEVVKGK
jgi:hypothetical protein